MSIHIEKNTRVMVQGITVHPRPDERHIRHADVRCLRPLLTTEFNMEGYPSADFSQLVLEVRPAQVTLVPDAPDQLTSNHGWNTVAQHDFLQSAFPVFARFFPINRKKTAGDKSK